MQAKAYMMNIPSYEFMCMPVGKLSDLVDAKDILNGFVDEFIEDNYIPDVR